MSARKSVTVSIVALCFILLLIAIGALYLKEDGATGRIIVPEKISEAIDYKNPYVRDFAISRIGNSTGYSISQICDLWDSIHGGWTYVSDPADTGYLSPASRTIAIGLKGNSNDFSIVNAAVIEAIGGSARIIITPGHSYPEVMIASSKSRLDEHEDYIRERYNCTGIYYHTETNGDRSYYWLNLDWSADHPGGPIIKSSGGYTVAYPN